jgi:hypothetical protein
VAAIPVLLSGRCEFTGARIPKQNLQPRLHTPEQWAPVRRQGWKARVHAKKEESLRQSSPVEAHKWPSSRRRKSSHSISLYSDSSPSQRQTSKPGLRPNSLASLLVTFLSLHILPHSRNKDADCVPSKRKVSHFLFWISRLILI